MSDNLLDGLKTKLKNGTTAESEGTWHHAARTQVDGHDDWLVWDLPDQAALETNQTYHVGLSTRGASANDTSLRMTIGYKDAAGKQNWTNSPALAIGTSWGRVEGTIVVPSGMKPFAFYVAAYGMCPEVWMAAPTLSLGSPVCLASSAHTPYATQDHLRSEYATKAALTTTADGIRDEVARKVTPIANGGTGATTKDGARKNLGIATVADVPRTVMYSDNGSPKSEVVWMCRNGVVTIAWAVSQATAAEWKVGSVGSKYAPAVLANDSLTVASWAPNGKTATAWIGSSGDLYLQCSVAQSDGRNIGSMSYFAHG